MKQHSPAAERNRVPIFEVLRAVLPEEGTVLEIASGTGQHAAFLAASLAASRPRLRWQPTDADPTALASIAAWTAEAGATTAEPPLALDVTAASWPVVAAAAVVCINMLHISPWAATEALLAGAARLLPVDGPLFVYGPFVQDGVATAPSNVQFDASLRSRDPRWGLRRLADVTALARSHGLELRQVVAMPANNLSVVFRKVAVLAD